MSERRFNSFLEVLVASLVRRTAYARGRVGLGEGVILDLGAMDPLLEDRLGFIELEFGLEVRKVVGVAATVGAAAGIGKIELLIDDLLTDSAPVSLACAVLLGLLGVNALEAILGEELGKVLMGMGCAVGDGTVVLVVEFVRSSHVELEFEYFELDANGFGDDSRSKAGMEFDMGREEECSRCCL